MEKLDVFLSRLKRVKKTGPDRWVACCPAHDDKRPSLAVRRTEDGLILVHCFAGCDIYEIISAVGMTIDDLFPDSRKEHSPLRAPFPATDVLRVVAREALLCASAASAMANGETLSEEDRRRLLKAAGRLQEAARLGGAN